MLGLDGWTDRYLDRFVCGAGGGRQRLSCTGSAYLWSGECHEDFIRSLSLPDRHLFNSHPLFISSSSASFFFLFSCFLLSFLFLLQVRVSTVYVVASFTMMRPRCFLSRRKGMEFLAPLSPCKKKLDVTLDSFVKRSAILHLSPVFFLSFFPPFCLSSDDQPSSFLYHFILYLASPFQRWSESSLGWIITHTYIRRLFFPRCLVHSFFLASTSYRPF